MVEFFPRTDPGHVFSDLFVPWDAVVAALELAQLACTRRSFQVVAGVRRVDCTDRRVQTPG